MNNQDNFSEDKIAVYEKIAKINFAFLTEKYGFWLSNIKKVDKNSIAIKYLSERVFVNLYYGSPNFELDFCIGRIGIEDVLIDEGFSSGDLAFLCKDTKWSNYKLYSAHSYENLYSCLPKLAELLKSCGDSCLKGSSLAYEKMLFEKKKRVNQWCTEQELKQAKKVASIAWENKDYSKFIEIFEPFIHVLTSSEKKKLEYARKVIQLAP